MFMFYTLILLSIVFSFYLGYKYGKKPKEYRITYIKENDINYDTKNYNN